MKLRRLIPAMPMILALLAPATAAGQVAAAVPLPADLQGELGAVPYRIRVPANWNGTLIVYAHGYGETTLPLALAPLPADVDALLAKGFALAASRFGGGVPVPPLVLAGYQVKEGMQNSVALTGAFRETFGRPLRTILWGKSLGGLIALGLIEKFPGLYDGAVALCAAGAGTPRRFDLFLDITLAYKAAFGWVPEWGSPGDLRDDLDYMTDVRPYVPAQNPGNLGLWEFIRLVNRLPRDSYYFSPTGLPERVQNLYFALAVRAELERRAGGPVAENIGREYTLSDADKAYLAGLGVDADALLAEMNRWTNITSDRNARNYAAHYVDPSGDIRRPVLTVHTTGDALAPFNHESAYFASVGHMGNGDLLMQQFTAGYRTPGGAVVNGHCTFTSAQNVAGIDAMVSWLDTGDRPEAFFPASLGFVPGLVPPPWPW
jgi:pimeloyl-ACP methyl ester carboxylesterase